MGSAIDREQFEATDYERFERRLRSGLSALEELLARPGFGQGQASVGAELELFLVGSRGQPLPLNQLVLEESPDARLDLELNRFNVECNVDPVTLAGRPFTHLAADLREVVHEASRAAQVHGGRVALVGILPTLTAEDLQPNAMSDVPRYRALSRSLRRLRGAPFRIAISGPEPLRTTSEYVTFEGANTSLQIHLRVDPGRFAAMYNAAQLAVAPVLAAAGNSPTFLGHHLWQETRIALFKQAVDARRVVNGRPQGRSRVTFGRQWLGCGFADLMAENLEHYPTLLPVCGDQEPGAAMAAGGVPSLDELRLHNGTVWRWNRPVYDPQGGGHLRIEMRALPAGPTVTDMLGNAAFLLGLTLELAKSSADLVAWFPFRLAHRNFYLAARQGLGAQLSWPGADGAVQLYAAGDLAQALLPLAQRGLVENGVELEEAERVLAPVAGRLGNGQTGACWQQAALGRLERRLGRREALGAMLLEYLHHADQDLPVHSWPMGGGERTQFPNPNGR